MPPRGPMRGPAKPKNAKGALSRLMRLLGPYRFRLLLVSFCILVSTGVSTYGAYLLRDVTNDYILPLRAEYVAAMKQSLRSQLDSTVIVRPDGTRQPLKKNGR